MLNDQEKTNIEEGMRLWAADCLKRDAYPILLLAMPESGNGDDIVIFRGGQYTVYQIRQLLLYLADRLQDAEGAVGLARDVFG